MKTRRRTAIWHCASAALWVGAVLVGVLSVSAVSAQVLQYGDGTADGKKSFGGGGHLIVFDAGQDGRWLNRVEMFGSRYGTATPPDEDLHVYVTDSEGTVLRQVALPYLLWERGTEYWRELAIPPIQVPRGFGIGLTFDAHQTKGVYVGTDQVVESHSHSWVPGTEGQPMEGVDWMVRAMVADAPDGDPEGTDLVILTTGEAFIDRLVSGQGDPLTVTFGMLGNVPRDEVSSIRFGVVSSPAATTATVVLVSGRKIECDIVSIGAESLRIRTQGRETTLPRSDVARIDLKQPL